MSCARTLDIVQVLDESGAVDMSELRRVDPVVPLGHKLMSVKGSMAPTWVGHRALVSGWNCHHSWHKACTGWAWRMELKDRGTGTDVPCSWLHVQLIATSSSWWSSSARKPFPRILESTPYTRDTSVAAASRIEQTFKFLRLPPAFRR
jgi:hypothetical protein